MKHKLVRRRGDKRAKSDMSDIFKVLLEVDHKDMPVFVAHNLLDLPPLTADNYDSLKLLQDMEAIKEQISPLTTSQKEVVQLVHTSLPCIKSIQQDQSMPQNGATADPQSDEEEGQTSEEGRCWCRARRTDV